MKSLYKKISVGALVALLIGGVSSQGLMVYANASSPKPRYDINGPHYVSDYYKEKYKFGFKLGAELFGYRIVLSNEDLNVDKIKGDKELPDWLKEYFIKILENPKLQKPSKYFHSYVFFMIYLNEVGLKAGMYRLWIGGNEFIIEVKKDINPHSVPEYEIWQIVDKVNEIFRGKK